MTDIRTAITIADRIPSAAITKARMRELRSEHETLIALARVQFEQALSWRLKEVARAAMNAELERVLSP
jgi:hypothetical protein